MHSWYGVSASAWGSDAKQSWFEIMMCKTFTQKELVIRCLAHSSPDLIMSWTALLWEDCWLGARGHEIFERQIAVWHIHNYTYCICISHHISIILFSFMQVVGYRPISVSISIPPSEPHQWDGCEQRPPILHGNTCNMATPIQSPNSELIYIYIQYHNDLSCFEGLLYAYLGCLAFPQWFSVPRIPRPKKPMPEPAAELFRDAKRSGPTHLPSGKLT